MNQMQQMLMEAQRMQRQLARAHEELEKKVFTVKKAGIVEVVVLGDRTIQSIHIEKDAIEPDNAEMLEETIQMALNEVLEQIQNESNAIDEKVTGQRGFPF